MELYQAQDDMVVLVIIQTLRLSLLRGYKEGAPQIEWLKLLYISRILKTANNSESRINSGLPALSVWHDTFLITI